jgi:hypothetical protein
MLRICHVGLLTLTVCVFVSGGRAQEKKDEKPEPAKKTQPAQPNRQKTDILQMNAELLKAVRELGVPSVTNKVTVYYSKGHEKRAKELSGLIEDAMRFYEEMLKIKPELSVAVLTKADWERVVEGTPFGFPFVSAAPHVVMLPATHDGAVVKAVTGLRGKASPTTLTKIEKAGFTFEQGAEKLVDLIGLHELGHVLTHAYGIRSPSLWSYEFLATYFAYAYLREARPEWATLFAAITYDLQYRDADKPKYTSLEDFDRLYLKLGPANYGWYQSAFLGRVEKVYDARRLSFLEKMRDAYPLEKKEKEPPRVVLERLEQICPGFRAWEQSLGGEIGNRSRPGTPKGVEKHR